MTHIFSRHRFILGYAFTFLALTSADAAADCINPASPEGRLIYNSTSKIAQVCDGTNWVSLGGSGGGGTSITSNNTEIIYNDAGTITGDPDLVFNKATNSVGIGVASPTQQLDVAGTATAQGILLKPIAGDPPAPAGASNLNALTDVDTSAAANGRVLTYNSTTSQWEAATIGGGTLSGGTAGYLGVWAGATSLGTSSTTAGQELFWDATNHRLGIGTTSPSRKLDIEQSATDYQMRIGDAGGSYYYDIGRNTTDGLLHFYGSQAVASGYVFDTVNGERMRITTAGNVGIGTSSPGRTLEITGTGLRSTASAGYQSIVAIKNSTYNTESSAGIAIEDGTADTGLLLGADAANDMAYVQSLDPATSYATRPLSLNPSGGNVGIGTTSPGAYKLNVNGSAYVTPDLLINNTNSGDNRPLLIQNSNVSATPNGMLYMWAQQPGNTSWHFLVATSDQGTTANARYILRGDGTAFADGSWNGGGADYAEYVSPAGGTKPADYPKGSLICVKTDETDEPDAYGFCGGANDAHIAGIISTFPGVIGNSPALEKGAPTREETHILLAMLGRVPLRLSLENGPIQIGDRIAAASKPGYGMKATEPARTIGFAVEDFDGSSGETATVFIQPEYSGTDDAIAEIEALREEIRALKASLR